MAPQRKSLTGLFLDLKIGSSSSSPSPTTSPVDLAKALRTTLTGKFPPFGTIKGKPIPASFTIKMASNGYDRFRTEGDPDEVFEQTEGLREEVSTMLSNLGSKNTGEFEDHIVDQLTCLIFSSNMIEDAGCGYDITLKMCQALFRGHPVTEDISTRDPEYEEARKDLIEMGRLNEDLDKESEVDIIFRSRREIYQHAKALVHLINEIVAKDNPFSENIITKTHQILCHKLDVEGLNYKGYAGQYRKVNVSTGLSLYPDPTLVSGLMKALVSELNSDLEVAALKGELDPYELASKMCYKFVNVHPFVDGNGRTCRLILNAILLKYSGSLAILGEKEDDREGYLAIAARATQANHTHDEDDTIGVPPWGELSSLTLMKAKDGLKGFWSTLKKKGKK